MKSEKPLKISYFHYMKPHLLWLLLGPLVIAMGGALEIFQTNFMADIVNVIQTPDGRTPEEVLDVILHDGGIMCLITLGAIIAGIVGVVLLTIGSLRFGTGLRTAMFGKVQTFSFENIDKFSTASLVTRLTNDITNVQNTIVQTLRMGTFTAAMLLSALINALLISPSLAALTLFSIPIIAMVITVIVKKGFPLFEKMQKAIDGLNARVQETTTNIRVIKSFVREKHETKRFHAAADHLCDISVKASGLMVTVMPLMQLVMNLTVVAALWFGAGKVVAGEIEIGNLTAYNEYIRHILMSMMMMSMTIIMYSRARASSRRLKEVLNEQSTITDKDDPVTSPIQKGTVVFDHVSFRYDPHSPDKVLDDISFTANAGEVIAIVGATGSAKTTLVSLIPRLYDVSDGAITVDGVDVRDYKLTTLRGAIGMVPQKNVLFSGSIRDNIRWGDENATDEQIRQAARDAQAEDFILALPDGYDTRLEQGGVNVSGGQKQRLCIARAMVKKPPILILDDSTSAVDSDTESRIRESFQTTLAGTTVFLIAQRVSSVRYADRILVLDQGRLAGIGTHDELMAQNEIYREIVLSQQKGGED